MSVVSAGMSDSASPQLNAHNMRIAVRWREIDKRGEKGKEWERRVCCDSRFLLSN